MTGIAPRGTCRRTSIFCRDELGFVVIVAAGIEISDQAREVAARDLNPDAVTFTEHVAGRVQVDVDFVHAIRLHENLFFIACTIAGPQDAVLDVVGGAVRININQLDREIGVPGR